MHRYTDRSLANVSCIRGERSKFYEKCWSVAGADPSRPFLLSQKNQNMLWSCYAEHLTRPKDKFYQWPVTAIRKQKSSFLGRQVLRQIVELNWILGFYLPNHDLIMRHAAVADSGLILTPMGSLTRPQWTGHGILHFVPFEMRAPPPGFHPAISCLVAQHNSH